MPIEPMLSEEMPANVLVARVLEEAGIEMVFGISGGHTGRIVSGLGQHQNSIRTVLVREESLGGVMAEVYGRLTRRPGVLLGQGPWVLGNGLIGTIEAYLSSSPMLLLTDFSDAPRFGLHAPYQQGTGDWGSWDARRAFSGVTKHVMQAHDPIAAVQATQLAIKHAMAGQPGPVAVLYSHDSLAGTVAPDSQPRLYPTRHYLPSVPPPAEPRQVEAAAAALAAAQEAGAGRRQRGAHRPGLQGAPAARRNGRAAGRDDRRRQGRLCRNPSLGARRLRHLWHRGGERLRRRIRSRLGRRLEIEPERHRLGKPRAARPDPAKLYPNRHRAAQRIVELPGRAPLDRRCRDRAGPARRGGRRARPRTPGGGGAPGCRPSRAPRLFQRPRLFRRRGADPAAARDRRVAACLARRCDRHLRRRRKPHHDDAFLPDQARRGVFAGGRARGRWVSASRQPSGQSSSIPTGRSSRSAATAALR